MLPNALPRCRCTRRNVAQRRALAMGLAMGLAMVAACEMDAPTMSGPPVAFERVSGDGQSAVPGAALSRPLVARLVDADGHPVGRVPVEWTATDGIITPTGGLTDRKGEARALWQVGTTPGVQRAAARASGLAPVEFTATVEEPAPPPRPLVGMSLETYDGSGQVVHPDVAATAFEGQPAAPRLAITPYPWGNANYENPSLFAPALAGDDPYTRWRVPDGGANPVVRPSGGYLSDPDVVWEPDRHELWMYYRAVSDENRILLARTRDGVTWTPSRVVVQAPNHEAVSPTVVRRASNDWLMWSVNSGRIGCGSKTTSVEVRRSSDGETWSAPETVALAQPGVYPWHLEVQWVAARSEYWALFNGKVAGSCTTAALYLATSTDGLSWRTYAAPVLQRGAIPELGDVVYRATFAYDPDRDVVSLWYSGARYAGRGYEWHAAFEQRRRADLFAMVNRRTSAAALRVSDAPPLTNATAP